MPRVSILMPCYNSGPYLQSAIDSALSQTFRDFELLIIDDGSDDEHSGILKKAPVADSRIKIIHQSNKGVGLARDFGLRNAVGEYIAFLDDDDLWLTPTKLAEQVWYLDAHPDLVLLGSAHNKIINESGDLLHYYDNPRTDSEIRALMLSRNCFVTSSVMFRRQSAIQAGGFTDMRLAEEYDLWLRMGRLGQMANLDDIDVAYRLRQASASSQKRLEMYQVTVRLIRQYKSAYPGYFSAICKAYTRIILHQVFGDALIQKMKRFSARG